MGGKYKHSHIGDITLLKINLYVYFAKGIGDIKFQNSQYHLIKVPVD